MRIIRYLDRAGHTHYGAEQFDGPPLRVEGDIFGDHRVTTEPADIAKLLAPVAPVQILGIGLNYRHHATETKAKIPERPILFVKGINTVQNPGDPILIPQHLRSDEVDYECELAVVIGRTCKNVNRDDALDYVLGYTCANDVSARDHQIKLGGGQWCRGKFFDTFCPLGPCLVTRDELPEPNKLRIATILNGERVQDWNTSDMIFRVPALIAYLSGSTTLPAGTVILTGTPHGVGMAVKPNPRWLRPRDVVSIEIERIGALTNQVQPEPL
jgi:2-keto-4-pentenoate hydratase/2-oxohepta-3-ene-1,7-dioic acid hydratase in catechol pathway